MTDFAVGHIRPVSTRTSSIPRLCEFSVKAIFGLMVLLPVIAAHAALSSHGMK